MLNQNHLARNGANLVQRVTGSGMIVGKQLTETAQ